ncbi:MAG: hypothetical protein A3F54_05530 [Candidatus Kerfeldbacteria bacterium RIFCSPHIGHO2_12_FULL_48_17]|uniref:Uncharacterized protein n=1 Tax=Candidatus Kerfeldbacteria bacterium RIFCSPHIGHO2_12_FULL_48_17 TaxID=1798542 RepID=A0A1G2B5R0_9BACT|nr:MAG: hypothetical protein A3F54_05530 [Candidatus Kerfeldbacteria bacterium RIFCSPHIGHO2_12_FULL_48_17]
MIKTIKIALLIIASICSLIIFGIMLPRWRIPEFTNVPEEYQKCSQGTAYYYYDEPTWIFIADINIKGKVKNGKEVFIATAYTILGIPISQVEVTCALDVSPNALGDYYHMWSLLPFFGLIALYSVAASFFLLMLSPIILLIYFIRKIKR